MNHIITGSVFTICGMDTLEKLGPRLKKKREELDLSQTDVATRANASPYGVDLKQAHISGMEVGRTLPSVRTLVALALALETSTDYLCGLTDWDTPASDYEDQILITVEDETERILMQRIVDLLKPTNASDKTFALMLIEKLVRRG